MDRGSKPPVMWRQQHTRCCGLPRDWGLTLSFASDPPTSPPCRAPYIVYLVLMFSFVVGAYLLYLHGNHIAG